MGSPRSWNTGFTAFFPTTTTYSRLAVGLARKAVSRSTNPARSRCRFGIKATIATEKTVGGHAAGWSMVRLPRRVSGFSASPPRGDCGDVVWGLGEPEGGGGGPLLGTEAGRGAGGGGGPRPPKRARRVRPIGG